MKRFTIFLTMVLSLCLIPAFGQTTIFVSTSGDDANTGATWETAKATLAGALTAATGNTHIYMMVGNYACNDVVVPSGVTVTGGYANTSSGTDTTLREYPGENSRWNNTTLCTILDANNTSRIATINTGGKLEGCVITKGKVNGNGGGVLVNGGEVQHCIIIRNSAVDDDNLTAKGGGAYIQNNGFILNCVIAYNRANNGPAVAGTDGTLTNNTITANYTSANCGKVYDIDGNIYNTIVIGDQCWMAENLRTTRYANGIEINNGTYASTYVPFRYAPPYTVYQVDPYGYLYNWSAVMQGQASSTTNPSGVLGICPLGWHVPSAAEWTQLVDYLQNHNAYRCGGAHDAVAKSLASITRWQSSETGCTVGNQQTDNNSTGFGAVPTGYYNSGNFNVFSQSAYYWSATSSDNNKALCRYLNKNSGLVNSSSESTALGFSVRCLRD